MIAAALAQIGRQAALSPALERAFAFLRRPDVSELPEGRTEIDGDRVYAVVQRYETLASGTPTFECHRTYLDVQYVASGAEIIGWAPAERMAVTTAYDAARDICFGTVDRGAWSPVLLRAGDAAVLWPEDAHAPRLAAGPPSQVVKIVVKVAL